jgi:hypothetical protein
LNHLEIHGIFSWKAGARYATAERNRDLGEAVGKGYGPRRLRDLAGFCS